MNNSTGYGNGVGRGGGTATAVTVTSLLRAPHPSGVPVTLTRDPDGNSLTHHRDGVTVSVTSVQAQTGCRGKG